MSGQGAYRDDPALKTAAIADGAAAKHPGWTSVATDEERLACAEAFGLSPALVALMSCAPNVPHWPGATERLVTYLTAIPVGSDTLAIARGWAAARWLEPPFDVASRLADTPAAAIAQRIVEAVTAAERPSPKAWRQMRSELGAVEGLTPTQRAYAAVAEAMAWDDADVFGVYVDVWKAWQEAIRIEHDQAAGWQQATQDEVQAALRDAFTLARERVTARLGDQAGTPEAQAAWMEEHGRIMAASPLAETHIALQRYWTEDLAPFFRDAHERGLDSILAACRAGG